MKKRLYTAVGKFRSKGQLGGMRYPYVTVGNRDCILDMQEMLLWSVLNWHILSFEELNALYEQKAAETGSSFTRSVQECLHRLIVRGLVVDGIGMTGAEALLDLLCDLYVVPISESLFLRTLSFVRLSVFGRVPYRVTKQLFRSDHRSEGEKQVIRLARQALLSTAEIIQCVEQNRLYFRSDDDLLDTLYGDEDVTSENVAYHVHDHSACRGVLTSVANLYLRKQIIFERS